MAFEVRYSEGYRYLDHCGETLNRIRRHDRSWIVNAVNPGAGQMLNDRKNLLLVFSNERINVGLSNPPIPLNEAAKFCEKFGAECESLYSIIVNTIGVTETTRVGFRVVLSAESDTLEESDRFVSKGARSPFLDKLKEISQSELRDASMAYALEDVQHGTRRRITVSSQAVVKPEDVPDTGLGSHAGTGSVLIDIDTFTRPESGHFPSSNMFIQNNMIRSRSIALETLQWLRQP